MIELVNINKKFGNKVVLKDFSLKIEDTDFIAIVGESGKGKTTLLNIIGLLEQSDSGDIIIEEQVNPNKKQTLLLQREKLAYLFQNYALMENETVEKNLLIALEYQKNIDKRKIIKEALQKVNLLNYEKKKIFELSGGEQQRIALARILIKKCDYILADEPTGNLDNNNRDLVFNILKELNEDGKTIIFVTHDMELASRAKKIITI
ncbi:MULTISPECIES: putative bacteriocin export ABC transporter [Bacillus cereus group]|jgi:putative ABC transport system ATP-binding protein|uniref:putative bacteriocin export ABC transporter n=1 Tax=Bacillus cereus group TaxID=86661 RepID=UPI000817D1C1|nr:MULTISPECIES: putative bacteriocin export ABC transporter [Bacillus cereus group]MBE7105435.1 ATP-binding cassette domain-containing protein [Bacillus cereus]MBE7129913.1 ATP-binding cassette domain-containing protein [Bacillus mycoides]MCU5577836.1 putative bacteriocin export ABC transporter [Bacillus wiedmannii]MEE3949765.1 putative bacteriocin export ABC transporter [Bacillus wiedmannii]PHE94651.1 bacteriocin ABC transporter ATP-binding protein [Bacillus wiedmannii]